MEAVKRHTTNAEVIVEAARALAQLAQRAPANKQVMNNEKVSRPPSQLYVDIASWLPLQVLDQLVELLNAHGTSLKVANEILRAIRNMVGQGAAQNLQQHMIPIEVSQSLEDSLSQGRSSFTSNCFR